MKTIVILILLSVCWAYGCSSDYYTDGGVLDNNVGVLGVSTMDYLENNSATFDTLTTLIKLCGLEDAVNAEGSTFLAPRDYSIHNYFDLVFSELDEWPATLSDIPEDNMEKISEILKNYIIPDKEIVRDSLSTSYSYVTTYGGRKARFNLIQEDYLENVDKGAKYIVFSLNVSDDEEEQYQSVQVVTSDLQSTNGIVHILDSSTHIFGFN